MPTHKVKGGYQWGKHGKVYTTKKQADKQGKAIYASGWKENNTNENINYKKMNKQLIRLTEQDLHNIIQESVNKILMNEAFSDYYNVSHFRTDDIDNDYYKSFVVLDGTRAIIGNFDNYDEAVEFANNMASQYKYGTYEVYGVDDDNTYSYDEEDSTLVYSTDEKYPY